MTIAIDMDGPRNLVDSLRRRGGRWGFRHYRPMNKTDSEAFTK